MNSNEFCCCRGDIQGREMAEMNIIVITIVIVIVCVCVFYMNSLEKISVNTNTTQADSGVTKTLKQLVISSKNIAVLRFCSPPTMPEHQSVNIPSASSLST